MPHIFAGMEPLNAAQNVSSTPNLPASLLAPLLKLRHSFVLADPHQPDTPMCYASPMFLSLTGYPREMVLGRNCRFLQGRGTDKAELQRLHNALCSTPPQAVTVRPAPLHLSLMSFWTGSTVPRSARESCLHLPSQLGGLCWLMHKIAPCLHMRILPPNAASCHAYHCSEAAKTAACSAHRASNLPWDDLIMVGMS